VYAKLARLRAADEQRFGFRVVIFVDRRPKTAVVEVLRARLSTPAEQELRTALHEMFAIARDRLETLGVTDDDGR
jgi:2-oxo-4-hydroxy-4-carboxy--5-ureidoimidazoline (OHCU) decarboxylase